MVVLYEHPLLGEGIARLLVSSTGAVVMAVRGDDCPAVASALAGRPRVVIVERGRLLDCLDVGLAAPGAVLIEVWLTAPDAVGGAQPALVLDVPEMLSRVRGALASPHRQRRAGPIA